MTRQLDLREAAALLQEAGAAVERLSGEIDTVRFDPEDPASIEAAVREMERSIDERVGNGADNPFLGDLVAHAKKHFRQAIMDKAAEARMGEDGPVEAER